ncbi:type II toxin-antitoxin system death-on-curing family toxin [Glutamicibacter sp. BSL13]
MGRYAGLACNPLSSHCLSFETVVKINKIVLRDYEPHAVIDKGKILGALGRPLHTFAGNVLYPTVPEQTGALIHGLATAHGFAEGNKRTSWIAGMSYMSAKGFEIRQVPNEEAGRTLLSLINREISLEAYIAWLALNLV